MINLIVILRTDLENKKCDSIKQQPNLISRQKPTFKEKPDKQFLRGKSHCNLLNKSKESKMFGRTHVIHFMDDGITFLTGSNLNVTRFKTETISLAREKSFSVDNLDK